MSNMLIRILAAAVGIPLAVLVIVAGGWWYNVAIIAVTTLALNEFYSLAATKGIAVNRYVGLVWSIAVQVFISIAAGGGGFQGLLWFAHSVVLFVAGILITLVAELFRNRENPIQNIAVTAMGVLYITLGMSALLVLRTGMMSFTNGTVGEKGASLVLVLFATVWLCDSAAYFAGMSFGKHKLFPRVSPKKSWEGALAGFAASVIGFALLSTWLMPQYPVWLGLVSGAVIGSIGQIGDLVESLLKRDAVVKDSSQLIPGHGGVLDRFDSMLFVAPAILILLTVAAILMGPF